MTTHYNGYFALKFTNESVYSICREMFSVIIHFIKYSIICVLNYRRFRTMLRLCIKYTKFALICCPFLSQINKVVATSIVLRAFLCDGIIRDKCTGGTFVSPLLFFFFFYGRRFFIAANAVNYVSACKLVSYRVRCVEIRKWWVLLVGAEYFTIYGIELGYGW